MLTEFFLKTKNAFFWSLTFIFLLIFRCRERLRLAKQTPDHEGPIHPIYSRFHLRRSLRRICHYYHHPSQPHRRFEEVKILNYSTYISTATFTSVYPCVLRSVTIYDFNWNAVVSQSAPFKSCLVSVQRENMHLVSPSDLLGLWVEEAK